MLLAVVTMVVPLLWRRILMFLWGLLEVSMCAKGEEFLLTSLQRHCGAGSEIREGTLDTSLYSHISSSAGASVAPRGLVRWTFARETFETTACHRSCVDWSTSFFFFLEGSPQELSYSWIDFDRPEKLFFTILTKGERKLDPGRRALDGHMGPHHLKPA